MGRSIVFLVALAAAPLAAACGHKPAPPADAVAQTGAKPGATSTGKPGPTEEAPIKVRNLSIEFQTLKGGWSPGSNAWEQDTESTADGNELMAEVRLKGGGNCTVDGPKIDIEYNGGRITAHRSAKRIFLTPKAALDRVAGKSDLLHTTDTRAHVTKVTAPGTAKACPTNPSDEIMEICIGSVQGGLGGC